MNGRDGAERYPQAETLPFEESLLRSLRALDPSLTLQWMQQAVALHDESDLVRARNATLRERPSDVKAYFRAQLRPVVTAQPAGALRPGPAPLRPIGGDDPYGF